MKLLRPVIVVLSLLALSLSGAAMLGADCSQSAAGGPDDMQSHHGGHADTATGDAADAGDVDCPCCDGCLAACAAGCGSAMFSPNLATVGAATDASNGLRSGDEFLPGPAPPVLIRPPILSR